MRVKSSGIPPGLANVQALGSAKFANTPPTGLKRRANAVARGGGGGCWAQLELTDALRLSYSTEIKRMGTRPTFEKN